MKRNILNGIMLIGALALGSCSTQKLASNQANKDDDVYFSNAKAGDAPVYVNTPQQVNQQNVYNNYNDDDYYYYDSYASRINRFGYFSPFGYYDDIYMGYSPYNAYYNPYGLALGLGAFGFGYGYNSLYSPYYAGFYGDYFGYSPYYGYNYFGTGYGYGPGGGYWGGYSAYRTTGYARPYRGSGAPTNSMVNRSTYNIGYNGNYPVNSAYPGRPNYSSGYGGRQATNGTNTRTYSTPYNNNSGSRPSRDDAPRQVYQPQVQSTPSNSGGYSGGNSGGGSSGGGGGGGGARPARP